MRNYALERGYKKSFMTEKQQVIAAMYRLKDYCKRHNCGKCQFYKDNECRLNEKPERWDIDE